MWCVSLACSLARSLVPKLPTPPSPSPPPNPPMHAQSHSLSKPPPFSRVVLCLGLGLGLVRGVAETQGSQRSVKGDEFCALENGHQCWCWCWCFGSSQVRLEGVFYSRHTLGTCMTTVLVGITVHVCTRLCFVVCSSVAGLAYGKYAEIELQIY